MLLCCPYRIYKDRDRALRESSKVITSLILKSIKVITNAILSYALISKLCPLLSIALYALIKSLFKP